MLATLLRRLGLVPGLVLFLLGLGAARPALATHLLGGEMTYRYLDANGPTDAPLRYEITLSIYNNCGNLAIRSAASLAIYSQDTGTRVVLTSTNYPYVTTSLAQPGIMSIPQTSRTACLQPAVPPGCTITGVSQPYELQKFVAIVNLPRSATGYYALFTDGNRNVDITNLYNAGGQTLTLYTALAPPALPNHSPVFSDLAVAVICANDTTFLLNNAVDADGDRLVYSFGQPYGTTNNNGQLNLPNFGFVPPPTIVGYTPGFGYSATTPFGTAVGNFAELDAASGIAKYSSTKVGAKYAVAVDVSEYRTVNGQEVLIGTTRRDLQLVVASCPTTKAPVLPPATVLPRNYTVEAGTSLSVPLTVTQADGHDLSLTLNSVLLDGAGGYDATLEGQVGTVTPGSPTGTATIMGSNGVVTGTLTFNTTCADARTTPYDVALLVKDTGCAGKTVVEVLHITVTKPKGPTAISGDATVCVLNTVHSYTASGGTAPSISWRVVGGTIVGSPTANPVQVNWASTGTGTIVARSTTQYGCPTDSVVQRVVVSQAGTLTATGTLTICQGGSTTLNIAGGAAPYTLTGGATPVTGNGPFVVSPTQTTTYTITGAALNGPCGATGQVTVVVNPLPVAAVGTATRRTCAGVPVTLGSAPVAGLTYSWSPATGLSSATSANPTATLTNTTSAPVTQTYTLTVTSTATGCVSTGTVAVTMLPAVLPGTIGADQTVCLGATPAPLTSTAAASGSTGTFVYQWQASADNVSWTAVTGATGATYSPGPAATLLYYRRIATDSCATATSNVVMVQTQTPLVAGVALPAPAPQCAGTAMTFTPVPTNGGAAPTYRWFVNNALVASTPTFTSSALADGDLVRVELTPTAGFCATGQPVATATVRLIPVALPTAAISIQTALPACSGSPVSFRADNVTNPGTGTQYQWQVDGVAVGGAQTAAAGNTFTISTLRDGQAVTLALRTTTACGPVSVVSNALKVAITPTPTVEAGPDKTIMEGDQVVLEGTADGTYPVTWAPTLGLTFAGNQLRPTAAPATTTTYTLSAQLGNCANQSTVTVTVTPRLRIPNALSPNGDGNDDTWQIDNIGAYPGNHVLVFNRWGSKIFETSGYRRGNEWNGSISGQPAPVGTYYYVITLGNGKSYSGPLTVVY